MTSFALTPGHNKKEAYLGTQSTTASAERVATMRATFNDAGFAALLVRLSKNRIRDWLGCTRSLCGSGRLYGGGDGEGRDTGVSQALGVSSKSIEPAPRKALRR